MTDAFSIKTLKHGAVYEVSKNNKARRKFLYNQTVLKLTQTVADREQFMCEMAGMVLVKTESSVHNEVSLKRLEQGGYLMVILESGEGVEPIKSSSAPATSKGSQPGFEVV